MHEDVDIANSADNNTPYTSAKYMDVVEFLEKASVSLFKWFEINLLKANVSKCRFLTSIDQKVSLNVDNFTITNNECEKHLGVKFDPKLIFDQHISDLCKRANGKVNALARITSYINLPKRRPLMNSFFKAQFNYCPLIWMCHSRGNNRNLS